MSQTAEGKHNNICEGGPCPGLVFTYRETSQKMKYRNGYYKKSAVTNNNNQVIWTWATNEK